MGLSTGIYLKREGTRYDEALVAEVSSVVGARLRNESPGSDNPVFEVVTDGIGCVLFETDPSFDPRFASYHTVLGLLGTRDDELNFPPPNGQSDYAATDDGWLLSSNSMGLT